jgi:hypothetical protein
MKYYALICLLGANAIRTSQSGLDEDTAPIDDVAVSSQPTDETTTEAHAYVESDDDRRGE